MIIGALASKLLLPVFAVLQQELGDGGGVLRNAFPVDLARFPLIPPFLFAVTLGRRSAGGSRRGLRGRLDEVWREGHVDGAVHHHFENLVEGDEAIVHH